MEKTFLVVAQENNEAIVVNASDAKDCICKYAEWSGENSDLFRKAIIGISDTLDLIDMYNHFSYSGILAITELTGKFYGRTDKITYIN